MATEKANALVLRLVEFSETSSICHLFTREFGKVRALAKGARRPKGPFESALDLLAQCRIVFLRKSSDALDLLTEAKLDKRFRPAPGEMSALYAGYYVAEFLLEMTDDGDAHPELYDAAITALASLEQASNTMRVVSRFELASLRILGHAPSLDQCVECGEDLELSPRMHFGQLAGGLLCEHCRHGKKQVVSVSKDVIMALRELAAPEGGSGSGDAHAFGHDRRISGELRALMSRYVANLVGHPLKMHAMLGDGPPPRRE